MDIHCKHCGEPVDMDELHYIEAAPFVGQSAATEYQLSIFNAIKTTDGYLDFHTAKDLFYRFGCSIFNGVLSPCKEEPICNETKLQAVSLLQEMLGDDVDGLAAMMDDFEYMDFFDE